LVRKARAMSAACWMATRGPRSERGGKEWGTEFIRTLLGTEQGDVLLAEGEVDLGKVVQGGELARIGRFQPDMGHSSGDRLRVVGSAVAVLLLLHPCFFSSETHCCCAGVVLLLPVLVIFRCRALYYFSLCSSSLYLSLFRPVTALGIYRLDDLI